MTVSYTSDHLLRLLLRWRGSVWQSVHKEILLFLIAYYSLNMSYRFLMSEAQQTTFEVVVMHVGKFQASHIPISFLLGFYVTMMVNRWWNQIELLPWPDNSLTICCFNINGTDDESRLKRRIICRYLNLSALLAFRDFSARVRKRFPTIHHLVQIGMMTREELNLYLEAPIPPDVKWMIPMEWIQRYFEDLLNQNKISPVLAGHVMRELNEYRSCFRKLLNYIWVSLPLVYTHVAAIAVYSYFLLAAIGQQSLMNGHVQTHGIPDSDVYVPIFSLLQLLFYLGWFKVGRELMDPFGELDNDFDLNFMLDRHVQGSYYIADQVRQRSPSLLPDIYDKVVEVKLPHTILSSKLREDLPKFPAHSALRHTKVDIDELSLFDPLLRRNRNSSGRLRMFGGGSMRSHSVQDLPAHHNAVQKRFSVQTANRNFVITKAHHSSNDHTYATVSGGNALANLVRMSLSESASADDMFPSPPPAAGVKNAL